MDTQGTLPNTLEDIIVTTLRITYCNREVGNGCELNPSQVPNQPRVMVDPDAPSPSNPNFRDTYIGNEAEQNFNTREFAELYNLELPAVVFFNCQRETGSDPLCPHNANAPPSEKYHEPPIRHRFDVAGNSGVTHKTSSSWICDSYKHP
ncbi:hypothetical protein JHK87_044211 [Glycine soja]|nr:hypothetical protein JHK87_044211 [Glycine soja]